MNEIISFSTTCSNLIEPMLTLDKNLKTERKKLAILEQNYEKQIKLFRNKVAREIIRSIEDITIRKFLRLPTYYCDTEKPYKSETVFGEIFKLYITENRLCFSGIRSSYQFFYIKPADFQKIGIRPTKKFIEKFLQKLSSSNNNVLDISFQEIRKLNYWGTNLGSYIFLKGRCHIKEIIDIK